jgi:hypothetical protein
VDFALGPFDGKSGKPDRHRPLNQIDGNHQGLASIDRRKNSMEQIERSTVG